MALWFPLALMTAAAIFVVLWPLGRSRAVPGSGGEVAVYRDQMRELERDRAAGLIGRAEADAARVEVSRRLLAAADTAERAPSASLSPWRRRFTALAAGIALPIGALGLYLAVGAPGLPDQPLVARTNGPPESRPLAGVLAQVEAHLERNPNDGRGWQVVAPVYMRLARFDDAVRARRNALRLLGPSAEREADLGEALVAEANGVVTADAKAAFDRALALDARDPKAQFFVGLAAEQDGKEAAAVAIWHDLLSRAPADAPWAHVVRESLARLEHKPDASAPGPSAADVAAAADLSPDQRAGMVRGMVDRLAERLSHDGSDLDGWVRLVRAYTVLGEQDRARGAAADARRALAGEADKLRRFDASVKGLVPDASVVGVETRQ
jgi:cytochrome c-type biogenesis protein CcmH